MTRRRDIGRVLDAWLAPGPTEAPDRVLDVLADRIAKVPQRRFAHRTERKHLMGPTLKLGIAATLAVGLGLTVSALAPRTNDLDASPQPSPSLAAPPEGIVIPPAARSGWLTDYRAIESLPPGQEAIVHLALSENDLVAEMRDGYLATSSATIDGTGDLQLWTPQGARGCDPGTVGRYSMAVDEAGPTTLTLALVDDACETRAQLLPGTYIREGCDNPAGGRCLGPLAPGTHQSVRFAVRESWKYPVRTRFGGLTYTVPEGWASFADYGPWTGLMPIESYREHLRDEAAWKDQIRVMARPAALDPSVLCEPFRADRTVGRTPQELVNWLFTHPALTVSDPIETSIGARPATILDVDIAPTWELTCPAWAGSTRWVPLILYPGEEATTGGALLDGGMNWGPGTGGGEVHDPNRLIVVDIGGDAVLIDLDTLDPADLPAFIERAMPIVETFEFPD